MEADRVRQTFIKKIKKHPVMLRYLMDGWQKLRVDVYGNGAGILIAEKWVPSKTRTKKLDGTWTTIQGKTLRPEVKAISHKHHKAFNLKFSGVRHDHVAFHIYLTNDNDLLQHTDTVMSDLSRFMHLVDTEE
jgi:hypothetical protein